MRVRFEFGYEQARDPNTVTCTIELLDSTLVGKSAKFSILALYEVKDSRAVNAQKTLFSKTLRLDSGGYSFSIPKSELRAYSYRGKMLNVILSCQLKIDDGLIFKSKISEDVQLHLQLKPKISGCATSLVEPMDHFCIRKNFSAIPVKNKVQFLVLALIAGIIIVINTILGLHDQMVPEQQTYFYSHRDSDGDAQSPLLNSLYGSGGVGLMVWLAMRRQLRSYMRFELKALPRKIDTSTKIAIKDLISGVSHVALHATTLRVVACNMECGQYIRGSGSNRRTVSFNEPVNGILLYEQKASKIPAGVPVEDYFSGEVRFESMFASLYPMQMHNDTHGIDVHWEVQLLHDHFVDQELVGPVGAFSYMTFLESGENLESQLNEDEDEDGLTFVLKRTDV